MTIEEQYKLLNKFAATKQGKWVEFWIKFDSVNNYHICLVCNKEFYYDPMNHEPYRKTIEDHQKNHIEKLKAFI